MTIEIAPTYALDTRILHRCKKKGVVYTHHKIVPLKGIVYGQGRWLPTKSLFVWKLSKM